MQRIKAFEILGDKIAELIKTENDDRLLTKIEQVRYYHSFRQLLLKFNQIAIKNNLDQPLVTLDSFFNDLFPDGYKSWNETRDILLFRIYEVLYDWLRQKNYIPEEIVEDNNVDDLNDIEKE
jgi:hypothetical protein